MMKVQKVKESIVEILKEELQYQKEGYSQWVMGVSIIKARDKAIADMPMYIARVIVRTSESAYVDGMQINFMMPQEDVIIGANYYENTPEFQGGTQLDALRWLRELGEEIYIQIENPYILKKVDEDYGF